MQNTVSKITIYPDYEALRGEIETIVKSGIPSDAEIIYSGRNTLYRIYLHGKPYIIKAFRHPNVINRYIYTTLRPSKAARSYINSLRLLKLGFNSPAPVAYAEVKQGQYLTDSYYISEEYDGRDIRDWQLLPDCDTMLHGLASEMWKLQCAGVWHKDFSGGNVLFKRRDDGSYEYYFVDVNRMEFNIRDRRKLMSMFKSVNLDLDETMRLARHFAEVSGRDFEEVRKEVLEARDSYFANQRRKRFWKRLFH